MRNCALRIVRVWVVMAVCTAGCQFADFQGSRGSPKTVARTDKGRALSQRQVADVQLSLARSLEAEGQADAAMDAYRKAIAKDPKRATGYWRLAILCDQQGNAQESTDLYKRALQLEPKNSDIRCDFGYSLYLQRRWAEAEMQFREALSIKPRNRRAHNNLGLLLAQNEQYGEALEEFHKAGCSEDDARVNLAFVAMLNRRWDKAREEFRLALAANPESAAARAGQEKLESIVAKIEGGEGSVVQASNERGAADTPPRQALHGAAR